MIFDSRSLEIKYGTVTGSRFPAYGHSHCRVIAHVPQVQPLEELLLKYLRFNLETCHNLLAGTRNTMAQA